MVYDPINFEINTWQTNDVRTQQERNLLRLLGNEYPVADGRVLRHIPLYILKGISNPDLIKRLKFKQGRG